VAALAERGWSAADLAKLIKDIPKTAVITGETEVRVPANRAVVNLKVTTENRSLQEALKLNLEFRNRLGEHLRKRGIPPERIQSSKFSSTPRHGIFGDNPRSHKVENTLRVTIEDEREFQGAAMAVDSWPEVQFAGMEFDYGDRDTLKARAVAAACDNANARIRTYEEKFGVKLVPVEFTEQAAQVGDPVPYAYDRKAYSSLPQPRQAAETAFIEAESGIADAVLSLGELVCRARVTVTCTVHSTRQ
ncbi:MAG TPA: SIMPL domain-containing protein, partial [Verrucomicrobiota bacterium]|nr:SIMPL domain-containing protein [Verrucomicrobiota bacterium]